MPLHPNSFLVFNQDGKFHTHLQDKADAGTVTGSLYDPSGTNIGTATVTLDTASSTVNAAATAGAISLNIGSTTNFKVGHRYTVGNADPDDYTAETVTIKSKTNNTITLLRPLLFDHAANDPISSTQVNLSVSGSLIQTIGDGYRVEIAYKVSGVQQQPQVEYFDVVRYNPMSFINTETLRDLDPTLTKKIPSGISFEDLKQQSWQMMMGRIKANYSAGSLVGSGNLTVAHSYLIRMLMAEIAGPDYLEYRNLMSQRFEEEFKVTLASMTFDFDQNGSTNSSLDKYRTVLKLARR